MHDVLHTIKSMHTTTQACLFENTVYTLWTLHLSFYYKFSAVVGTELSRDDVGFFGVERDCASGDRYVVL